MSKPDYRYKYLKYKTKCMLLQRAGSDQDNTCDFTKFPSWIVDMSKKYKESVDYSRFTIIKESVYSSELPFHIPIWKSIVSKIIKRSNKDSISMLDMTANIGGLTINMAKLFKNLNITAVELDRCAYLALTNNVKEFDLADQIKPIHANSIDYLNGQFHKYDFVAIDPPWGGPDYKKHKHLKLFLGETDVHKVINKIFTKGISTIVLLKAPTNFKFKLRKLYRTKRVKFMKPNGRDVSYYVYYIENITDSSNHT